MRVTDRELARVRLHEGDLLLVEGHGNASQIGRVAVWDGSIHNCAHQNHLIRARPNPGSIVPSFACAFLNSTSGRQHLLREAKTTSGLNTITTTDVKLCPILLPPIELQQRFAETVDAVQELTTRTEVAAMACANLSGSVTEKLLASDET